MHSVSGHAPFVLYLDQKDWAHLDLALRGRARNAAEASAAKTVARWVEQGRVVLPISAGHVDELDKQASETRRRLLGETMLRLSGPWKMISPLAVRRMELEAAVHCAVRSGTSFPPRAVFVAEPGPVYLAEYMPWEPSSDIPEATRKIIAARVEEDRHQSLLLEKSRSPWEDADAISGKQRWTDGIQPLADFLKENRRRGQELRAVAAGVLISDLKDELAAAFAQTGVTPQASEAIDTWELIECFEHQPFLRLLLHLYERRFRNPGDPWKANDLNDIHFLGVAAAYGDALAMEKHFHKLFSDIQTSARVRASMFKSLPACVEALTLS